MKQEPPMNFLIIMSDQHSKRMLGCYGNSKISTPNLDKLASDGVCFDNAYCNSPICVPSRAAFASGRYPHEGLWWDNAHAYNGELQSWGGCLHEQGYTVTTIGKLHYKSDDPVTGFTDQRIPLNIKNGIGDIYGSIRDKNITRYQFRDALLQACSGESDYLRYDREIAKRAAEYLRTIASKNPGKPFALHVGFVTPHFPLIAPPEFTAMYPDKESVLEPLDFYKKDWAHHPVVDDYRRYCGSEQISEDQAWNAIRTYYALTSFMDAQVGIVLDSLRETNLDQTTRVIYTADHGDTMGDHGVYFKSTMYEGSAGIPFIVSGPDIPKNTRNRTIVSLVDIFPTAVTCLGATLPEELSDLRGESIWQYARGMENEKRIAFSEYYAQGIYTAMFLLRKGKYKYIYYAGEIPQLFDLEADPDEHTDLGTNPMYQSIIRDMDSTLRASAPVDELEVRSKAAQKQLLDKHGGREEFLRTFKPALFSPIPDLTA